MIPSFSILANGFLPTRGSVMLDFVTLAMPAVVIALLVSIYLVRVKKKPGLHRAIQIGTALVLLLSILAFEIDMRFMTDWRELAKASPFYESGAVDRSMWIHLCFAVPTPFVWAWLIIWSWRKFKTGYQQGSSNRTHRIVGWLATIMMVMTAATGWVFYYMAFMAT